jgi:hypothetical protein
MTTTKSWLESWWRLDDGSNITAPIVNGGNFWLGLSPLHFELQVKTRGALLAVLSSYVAS